MPKKNFIQIAIAAEQYDRCADCPLCGLIPENKRREGLRKKYICLGADFDDLSRVYDGNIVTVLGHNTQIVGD